MPPSSRPSRRTPASTARPCARIERQLVVTKYNAVLVEDQRKLKVQVTVVLRLLGVIGKGATADMDTWTGSRLHMLEALVAL